MKTPTFTEQYNKIVGAYIRNKLNPMDGCACFIGNLLNGHNDWLYGRDPDGYNLINPFLLTGEQSANLCVKNQSNGLYNMRDISDMEYNFLKIWVDGDRSEKSLFDAMESTLIMLRELHESKGEIVEYYNFQKRVLS